MDENDMKATANYTIGTFVATLAKQNATPAEIAHSLFILIEEAMKRRKDWIGSYQEKNNG